MFVSKSIYHFPFSETITEVFCDNPGASCSKSKMFTCKQEKNRMEVAFYNTDESDNKIIRTVRNVTVNVGCSCVTSKIRLLKQLTKGPEE